MVTAGLPHQRPPATLPAIVQMLRDVAPATGRALEIASGTGQHIVQLAAALPGLSWQPSDIDPSAAGQYRGLGG